MMSRKLGKLHVSYNNNTRKTAAIRRRRALARFTITVLFAVAIALLALGISWARSAVAAQASPQRILIRGCWLGNAEDVLTTLGYYDGCSISELRTNAEEANADDGDWLRHVSVQQFDLHKLLIIVDEQRPLIKLTVHGDSYWLCENRSLIKIERMIESEKLARLGQLPVVELAAFPKDFTELADTLLEMVSCIEDTMPNRINSIIVDKDNEFSMRASNGLLILLGQPDDFSKRICAIQREMHSCDNNISKIRCIDARKPNVFYEEWTEPISK